MSGLNEIIQWTQDNFDFSGFETAEDAFRILNETEDWRNDLNDILKADKPAFLEFLASKITPKPEFEPEAEFSPQITEALRFLFG